MRVGATNPGKPSDLTVAFYKAVKKSVRPTNEETQALAQEFTDRLETIDGVAIVEIVFTDRNK